MCSQFLVTDLPIAVLILCPLMCLSCSVMTRGWFKDGGTWGTMTTRFFSLRLKISIMIFSITGSLKIHLKLFYINRIAVFSADNKGCGVWRVRSFGLCTNICRKAWKSYIVFLVLSWYTYLFSHTSVSRYVFLHKYVYMHNKCVIAYSFVSPCKCL